MNIPLLRKLKGNMDKCIWKKNISKCVCVFRQTSSSKYIKESDISYHGYKSGTHIPNSMVRTNSNCSPKQDSGEIFGGKKLKKEVQLIFLHEIFECFL